MFGGEDRLGRPAINSGRETRVGEMSTTIHQRLSDAYDSLRVAHDTGDDLMAEAREAEIADLRRTAASHGIDVPRCA
jgi:hypothetical protein